MLSRCTSVMCLQRIQFAVYNVVISVRSYMRKKILSFLYCASVYHVIFYISL